MATGIGIVTFPHIDGAEEFLKTLKQLKKEGVLTIDDAVIVTKDASGKSHVKQTKDLTTGKGAAKGGTLGFVVGLLLGGPIGGALLGVAAGALLGKKIDLGVPEEKIKLVTEEMPTSSSVLFVQGHTAVDGIFARAVEQAGGNLHDIELSAQAMVDVQKAAALRS